MAQEVAFGWNDDAGYYLAHRKFMLLAKDWNVSYGGNNRRSVCGRLF
jgi:hypothetical protein